MANLGTLTTKGNAAIRGYIVSGWLAGAVATVNIDRRARPRNIPFWAISPTTNATGIDVNVAGSISGNVKEGASNVPYCWVHLYYRPTGERIRSTKTDANGNFTFTDLQASQSLYYVVALDPDGGTTYNAQIYDRVAPS